jgi:hypothetical protein
MSSYIGDFVNDYATFNFKFTTRAPTGVPTVLAGTPVITVHKDGETGTVKTSGEAYITLTPNFNSIVGANYVLIDLSADAFFEPGKDYSVIITTGTVGGVSVVGEKVGSFSIENRSAALASALSTHDGDIKSQLGNLGSGSGAGGSVVVSDDLITAGTEVGTFALTDAFDGNYHIVNLDGTIDFWYEFDLGPNGIPLQVIWEGYALGINKLFTIKAWDWVSSTWKGVGPDIVGTVLATTLQSAPFALLGSQVGTNGDVGLVRWQVTSPDGTAFATDRIRCTRSIAGSVVGYQNSAVWINGNEPNTNTVPDVDGVGDNPNSTMASALAVAGLKGLSRFEVINGTDLLFEQDMTGFEFRGRNYNIDFNGENADRLYVRGATVDGVLTSSGPLGFRGCRLADGVSIPSAGFGDCVLPGELTLTGAFYMFAECKSAVAGLDAPSLVYADAGPQCVNWRNGSGGVEVKGMEAGDIMSLEGRGQLIINADCAGGTIVIRGLFTVTDNVDGGFVNAGGVISDNARYDTGQITASVPTVTEITADIDANSTQLALLAARLNAQRALYLDNLGIGENVAGSSEVTSIQNNTRCVRVVPTIVERPDSGSVVYRVELMLYDTDGNMEAPDSAPTIDLVNESGTDRSARLDSTTMSLISTGRYRAEYTASDSDALEQLNWTFTVIAAAATRVYGNTSIVVDTTAVDFTAADRAKLTAIDDLTKADGDGDLAKNLDNTNELQTDWTDGGRLDLLLDDIPNTAEFVARTLASGAYVVVSDTIAGVTLVSGLANNIITESSIADDALTANAFADNALESAAFATGYYSSIALAAKSALTDMHLNYLFATSYDPANPPGVATAYLNALVEDDGNGDVRYTILALSNASGTGASVVDIVNGMFNAIWATYEIEASFGEWVGLVLAKVNKIGTVTANYSSPVAAGGAFSIQGGDDYLDADGRALEMVASDWPGPDLTDADGELRILNTDDYTGTDTVAADLVVAATITVDGTTVTVKADLTAAQTAALEPAPPEDRRNYQYQFVATTATPSEVTIGTGRMTVKKGIV